MLIFISEEGGKHKTCNDNEKMAKDNPIYKARVCLY